MYTSSPSHHLALLFTPPPLDLFSICKTAAGALGDFEAHAAPSHPISLHEITITRPNAKLVQIVSRGGQELRNRDLEAEAAPWCSFSSLQSCRVHPTLQNSASHPPKLLYLDSPLFADLRTTWRQEHLEKEKVKQDRYAAKMEKIQQRKKERLALRAEKVAAKAKAQARDAVKEESAEVC